MPNRGSSIEKVKKTPQKKAARNVREAALELLHQLFQHSEDGTPLPVMLSRAVEASGLGVRDAALLSELCFGVLRRSVLLDELLASLLKKPAALSAQIRMLLRLGAYEILFMDGIPARATVNELVTLARRRFGQGLGGLVNGVLRSVDRDSAALRERAAGTSSAVAASMPAWLMAMWEEQYGVEKADAFAFNTLAHAAPCWRVNMAREGAEALRESWLTRGYVPAGEGGFSAFGLSRERAEAHEEQAELSRLEAEGAVSRQGVSSQLVTEAVARLIAQDAELALAELWDACCGRGGKTAALLEKGVHVALSSDPAQFRVDELKRTVQCLDLPEPCVMCATEQEVEASFPLILLDVPCSGTGTLGRVPELRLRLSPEKLAEAERLQASILNDAWGKLQSGGMLFYVTCALNRRENEGQVERFLQAHGVENGGDASLVDQCLFLPEFPGHDALFFAVLKKR
ncbi:transcription antitermination factor NusB [Mailhella sp.]|uniref:transcription antitermination factor NusB n=1 Tax=Mailhella sp. TaxID=1981029 RepID=UPI004064106C